MADGVVADVVVEWLEAAGAGSGSFKPLRARGVRVAVFIPEDSGTAVLTLALKPKELSLPLRRLRIFAGCVAQGKLTLRLEPERRERGAQVMLSGVSDSASLLALARCADAACRCVSVAAPTQRSDAPPRAPLAPLNRNKRPLGPSPGKSEPAPGKAARDLAGIAPLPRFDAATPAAPPLSASQRRAVELVSSRQNVFITGAAGTGKSHVLRHVLAASPCRRGATFLTAPTGLAACELGPGAMTLNAFAGVGRGEGTAEELLALVRRSRAAVARWKAASRLVVDEVSMLDAHLFDALDYIAHEIRGKDAPFGGIQLILCGDFFQLPPVCRDGGGAAPASAFAFSAAAWAEAKLVTVELREPFRQTDPAFFRVLNAVRIGELDAEAEAALARCAAPAPAPADGAAGTTIIHTKLYTHRADVERENALALAGLPGDVALFASEDGGPPGTDAAEVARRLKGSCPARAALRLKTGAQVMLLRSVASAAGLVNGARGVVTGFTTDSSRLPIVRFACGVTTPVCRVRWEAVGCSRTQLPLELAWALSVHKAQGMSLDRVEVSLSRAFEVGQAYVALSRARTLAGLRIAGGGVSRDAIRAHPAVRDFYAALRGEEQGDADEQENKPRALK